MKITEEQLLVLKEFKQKRDEMAYKMGILTYSYNQEINQLQKCIRESEKSEKSIGNTFLVQKGLSPDQLEYKIEMDGNIKILNITSNCYEDIITMEVD